jgi:pre-rRNA-processing protein TSR2
MAVRDQLGGPDSADKRDWFCGAVVDLYPEFTASTITTAETNTPAATNQTAPKTGEEFDNSDIQEFLAGVMQDEFELILEEGDPMLWQVAEQIVRIRRDCAKGNFANVEALRTRWEQGRGRSVDHLFKRGEDPAQETDGDSEDEDDEDGKDIEMDEAPSLVREPKERPEPELDEDGFTKVTRKKR